ncbi:MAG: hypothetical protein HN350_03970, partial [Phycisphaerales bacterium]|nr:hypothetical protein [Phycisphaerales bacterium]
STPAVGAVHAIAIKQTETRDYACVVCHNHIHTTPPPPREPKYYDEADNSFCYVCHINFKKEPFVLQHRAANIGCSDCHGESLPHADDEDNATAPMIMYTKQVVNASCGKSGCHSEKRMKKVTSHKAWYAAGGPKGSDTKTGKKYCTDCHGMHKIDERQRKWDKKTKILIWRDGHDVDPKDAPSTQPSDDDEMGMDGMGM